MEKVYVTKYALTKGILEFELIEIKNDGMMVIVHNEKDLNRRSCFQGKDWHCNYYDAVKHAKLMKRNKILALKKQIEKLENLHF